MTKKNNKMADLIFQHKEIQSHKEYWTVKDGFVNIHSVCPQNHPSEETFDMTPIGALKQYVLMTSKIEYWEVIYETSEWHEFVDNIVIND